MLRAIRPRLLSYNFPYKIATSLLSWAGCLICLLWGSALSAYGQQSFFNVPSSDITPKSKVFFQQQFSVYDGGAQFNTTISYGLGRGTEVGVNLLGVSYLSGNKVSFNDYDKPYSPLLAINAQKKFELSKKYAIGTGCQIGVNRVGNAGAYIYSNHVYLLEKTKTKFVGGVYYSTDGYFGPETRNWSERKTLRDFGLQWGIEQNIWKEKWFFQTDYISGRHDLGQIVFGAAYCVTKHWIASSGLQLSTSNSKALDEIVIELTYAP